MSQWTCWRVRRCLSFWPLDVDDAFIWNNQPGIVRFLGRWDVGKWTRRTPGGPARSLVLWPTRYVDTHRKKRCMWGRSVGVQHFSCGRGPNSQRWLCLLVHVVTTTYLVLMVPSTSILSHLQAGGSISIFPQVCWWNLHWWCLHDPLWS
jgi:hypothetical protein